MKIEEVEGIGPVFAEKLGEVGIVTTDDLLERGGKKSGRAAIAIETGINEGMILEWTNHVDLMRIKGVGSEFSDMLEAAGVDSPAELAQRNPVNLAETLAELDMARNTTRRIPSAEMVAGWIAEARTMERSVEH
ncbi:MAG TPA: DUF4332 domain-containing protein [Candidatus Limnocylindria bacterium]|jgi:predicted flap endonuclease-1-like 5' DNA nuclease